MPGLKDLLRDRDLSFGLEDLLDLDRSLLYLGEGEREARRLGEERGEIGLLDPEEWREALS